MPFYLTQAPMETGSLRVYSLDEEVPLYIGRDHRCDIHLSAQSVSRTHCRLTVHGTRVWIRDEGSHNGTWRAGVRLSQRREPFELRVGETIQVGPYYLLLGTSPGVTRRTWQTSLDLLSLLSYRRAPGAQRKLRLFACACCREFWSELTDPTSRGVIDTAELFADEETSRASLQDMYNAATVAASQALRSDRGMMTAAAATAAPSADYSAYQTWQLLHTGLLDNNRICELARDLFGDFFSRAEVPPAWKHWQSGLVGKMAEGIYRERTFDELPILADALEDAGCDDPTLLDHCRSDKPHARGCWVIDALRPDPVSGLGGWRDEL